LSHEAFTAKDAKDMKRGTGKLALPLPRFVFFMPFVVKNSSMRGTEA